MSKSVGKITNAEIAYIVENCKAQSIQEMAEHLNRSEEAVKRHLLEKGLWVEKTEAELEEEARMRLELYNLAYWPSVVTAYENDEIIYFENNWISIVKQLNKDVSYTEHLYIKDWIQLEIEKKRLLVNQKETRQSIRDLDAKIKAKEIEEEVGLLTPVDQALLGQYRTTLAMMRGAEGQHISQIQKINGDIKNISAKVRSDREQRRSVAASADTYWGYLACLQEEAYRQEESYRAELGRLAQEKARQDLMELAEYIDKTVDYPLLNSDVIEKLEREQNGD